VDTAATSFPWRELGELLIAEELLTEDELELALAEQASSGRLLAQILVDNGYVSAFSLARVLSRQHGVELESIAEEKPPTQHPEGRLNGWRPLGRILVELEFLTETQLERALALQQEEQGRLGELLVSRGLVSGPELAQALAEQHGIELEPQVEGYEEPGTRQRFREEPLYEVVEVRLDGEYVQPTQLYETQNFLEAADYACTFMENNTPERLEIHRLQGSLRETVWEYNASRAAETKANGKELVGTFGFDPSRRFAQR
jgi:hypothetical protein